MAGFDDVKDKGLLSSKGEDLLRQRKRRMEQKSVEETRLMSDLMKEIDSLNKTYDSFDSMIEDNNSQMIKRIQETRQNIEKAKAAHAANVQKQFSGGVSTQLGVRGTSEAITAASSASTMLGGALTSAQNTPTSVLEQQVARNRSLLHAQRERIMETAQNIDQPGMQAQFQLQMGARGRIINNIGEAQASLRAQRKLGLDTQSQYYRANDITNRVRGDRQGYQVAEDVSAGRVGSREQVQERLDSVGSKLIETFEKLDAAIKSNSEDAAKLGEEFRKLDEQYSKTSLTAKEMDRQGGGGYDKFRSLAEGFGMLGDAGVVAQGAAQGYRYNSITSEMAQTQTMMGFANLSNQRFTDQRSAAGGDAAALRRVLSDTFERQSRRGAEFGTREEDALTGEIAGKGMQLGASLSGGILDSLNPFSGKKGKGGGVGKATGKMAGGILGALPGMAAGGTADALQLNKMVTDLRKNIAAGNTAIQAANQQRELEDIVNVVPDAANQQMIDTLKSTTLSTRGLGVGGKVTGAGFSNVKGIGGLGGTPVRADITSDIASVAEAEAGSASAGEMSRVKKIKDVMNKISSGTATEDDKAYLRSQTNPNAIHRLTGKKPTNRSIGSAVPGRSSQIETGMTDRESLQQLLLDPKNRESLAAAGLSGAELNQTTSAGISGLGKEMMGQGGLNALQNAGNFTQAGYFQSPGQYMQARSALTGVGGGADDLEKTMRQAVAAGMDSSKNIMEMVAATSQMASTSASAGISAVGGASAMLGRGTQALRNSGVSANMATKAAQKASMTASKMGTDGGMDIFNVMEFANLREQFGDADLYQLEALQTADPQELEQLAQVFKNKGDKAGQKEATRMGYGALKSGADVAKAQKTTRNQVLDRTMGIGINEKLRGEVLAGAESGTSFDKLSGDAQDFFNARARKQDRGLSGEALYAAGDFSKQAMEGGLARGKTGTTTAGGEGALAGSGMADAKLFSAAVSQFDNHVKGLASIGTIIGEMSKIDPTKFAETTKLAAEQMALPASQFSEKLVQFNGAISRFTGAIDAATGKLMGISDNPLRNQGGTGNARKPGTK